jgi:WD40 repeat protein
MSEHKDQSSHNLRATLNRLWEFTDHFISGNIRAKKTLSQTNSIAEKFASIDLGKKLEALSEEKRHYWLNLPWHWVRGDEPEKAKTLLLQIDFLYFKLKAIGNVRGVIPDYELLPKEKTLHFIASALRLSENILENDPSQLSTELYARLVSKHENQLELAEFLDLIATHERIPALISIEASTSQSGGNVMRVFTKHTREVKALTIAGEYSFSGDSAGVIEVWEWATGQIKVTLADHRHVVCALAIGGDKLISAAGDRRVYVWDWQAGVQLYALSFKEWVEAAVVNEEYILLASGNEVLVWNWVNDEYIRTLSGHEGKVYAVTVKENYAFTTSLDKTVRVWDWKTGEHIRTLIGHTNWVSAVAVSGEHVLSGSRDTTVKVWNWKTGKLVHTLKAREWVRAVALSGDYVLVASGSSFYVMNWLTGTALKSIRASSDEIYDIAIVNDFALCASRDGTVAVVRWFDRNEPEKRPTRFNLNLIRNWYQEAIRYGGYFDLDGIENIGSGYRRFKGMHNEPIRLLKAVDGHILSASESKRETGITITVQHSPSDSERLIGKRQGWCKRLKALDHYAFVATNRHIQVWDWTKLRRLRTFREYDNVPGMVVTNDYMLLLFKQMIEIWDWKNGKHLHVFHTQNNRIDDVLTSGHYAFVKNRNKIDIYDVRTGDLTQSYEGHTVWIADFVLADMVVVSRAGGTNKRNERDDFRLHVWDWTTGKLLRALG